MSRLHECMLVTSTVHACQADGSKSLLARAAPLHFGWRTARECASPWPPRLAARLKSLHLSLCSLARQQGSDVCTATCGYVMASMAEDWVAASLVQQGVPPPSASAQSFAA